MTANRLSLLALLLCLYAQPLFAQAPADSAAFAQGRLRIWCETTRFVYEDNQADSLLPSLNCQSWEGLRASMTRTDGSLGVLRLLNGVDKPAIYQGYATTEARLQKLVSEITNRLRQSPVRRNSPARLQGVDSLQQQLLLLVRQTDPEPAPSGSADPLAGSRPEEEESNEALYPPVAGASQADTGSGPLPWNEILQWLLLLVLTGFGIWRVREYEERHSRMKREFRTLEKQVNEFMIANLQAPAPPSAKKALSELEVRKVVKEELKQSKPEPAARLANTPKPSQQPGQQQQQPPVQTSPTLPPPPEQPAVQAQPAPPSAAAERSAGTEDTAGLYYDKMPFRGGFHQHELSRERQRDSLYTIRLGGAPQGEADYWVTEDPEIQRYAMQNGMSFFEEGCDFSGMEENPSRVVNEQKGRLRKEGSVWKIIQKARVRFE
ncbi:hypothetical protein [Cesiribacter andamanensis]|uniref:Uncharacterized protein n=1 Tax=Cesiribacter andamanensis AMV16 TaxID=1279009 RepID=M7NQW7_9BACT|nr:hypothetical protein [Cesiribacter andamanensis]EMR04110.1 hypothetical protein ADICEAN_00733 [Cesiribacter andamanensis AMV16]